ncbi:hypothetical protein QSV34_10515 [Porticoccus sp. W117]|uniref:hypothetical protein n=1 Tax=Porticoccus sp. W117 TaxID=3054777 RepID=UPI002591D6E1|nr:hypothetical protein [Porticoccus sp. W117]MDM3871783.1 hypothetical protein [Porticoccus sp. W117]
MSSLFNSFNTAAQDVELAPTRSKVARPFTLRLSDEERTELGRLAGSQSWGAYIRSQVFGENASKRRTLRKPQLNDRKLAVVLSALGDSRLSQNLNQLAKHANIGTLDMTPIVEQELLEACQAVVTMRELLLSALGHNG